MNSVKAPPLRIAHPKLATCLALSEVNPTALTFRPCTLEAERTSLIKIIVIIRFGHCTEEISLLLPERCTGPGLQNYAYMFSVLAQACAFTYVGE